MAKKNNNKNSKKKGNPKSGKKRPVSKKQSPKTSSKKASGKHIQKKKAKRKPVEEVYEEPVGSSSLNKPFWYNKTLQQWIIFAIGCILYFNTLPNQYAVDDSIVIQRNAFTKKGLKGMPGIWGEDTFVGFFGGKRNLVSGGRYRPFTVATFALENQLFGKVVKDGNKNPVKDADGDIIYEGNPLFSHLINVLLFGFLCMVLYLWIYELFKNHKANSDTGLYAFFIAFTAAALFAAHPVHVEAVANIKGRDEIMVTLGSVLAAYWTIRHLDTSKWLYMLGAVLAFIIALFSKESAIPFLVVIPLSIYFFRKAVDLVKIGAYTLPFILIVGIFWFGIRNPILDLGGKGEPAPELMNNPFMKLAPTADGRQAYVDYTSSEKYGTIVYTWLEYLRLMVVPHPLTNDYYPKHIRGAENEIPTLSSPTVLLSLLIHIGLAILAFIGLLRRQPYAFALIFYAATFSVVSNLFFPIGTNMAERFLFMPSIGFSLLCGLGLVELARRIEPAAKEVLQIKHLKIPLYIFAGVMVLYSIKTFDRNFDWYNDYTLFTTDIEVSENSAKLNNAVSGVIQDKAQNDPDLTKVEKKEMLQKALFHSDRALKLHPTYNNAWLLYGNANTLLGNMLKEEKNYVEALKLYNEGLKAYKEVNRLRPNHNDVPLNLSSAYRARADLQQAKMNQGQQAVQAFNQDVNHFQNLITNDKKNLQQIKNYQPNWNNWIALADIYVVKADVLAKMNNFQPAIGQYDQAVAVLEDLNKIKPNHPRYLGAVLNALKEKGKLLGQRMGQLGPAIETFERANRYAKNKDAELLRLAGVSYGLNKNHQKAIEKFQQALQLNPRNVTVLSSLEVAYQQLKMQSEAAGDTAKAQEYAKKAMEYQNKWKAINPSYDPRAQQ